MRTGVPNPSDLIGRLPTPRWCRVLAVAPLRLRDRMRDEFFEDCLINICQSLDVKTGPDQLVA
jgi:hypothetical protein